MMGDSPPGTPPPPPPRPPFPRTQQSQKDTPPSKRARTARATVNQIAALLAALEAQPFLATRRFTGLQGRENYDHAWAKVAADLNRAINGAVKTPDQWQTVWRDLKSRACIKAAKIKREKVQTGNRPITTLPLSVIEERVVSIVGVDYTMGTNCPDSMPGEDELQHELEAENEIKIEIIDLRSDEAHLIPQDEIENQQVLGSEMIQIDDATTVNSRNAPASTTPEHQVRSRRNRNLNPRRSVAEQHNSARTDFLAVAQSNAESMRMLAAAATQQAEAAKVQAEASLLFAQALNKIADALLLEKNKNS